MFGLPTVMTSSAFHTLAFLLSLSAFSLSLLFCFHTQWRPFLPGLKYEVIDSAYISLYTGKCCFCLADRHKVSGIRTQRMTLRRMWRTANCKGTTYQWFFWVVFFSSCDLILTSQISPKTLFYRISF